MLIWLDFGSESPKTCDTLLNGSLQFYCFILCHVLIDIFVLNVFRIKPTFCERSLREDGAHVMLYTHGRAYIEIYTMMVQ